MLAVRWTANALAQLDTVTTYVQARNFDAAERLRLLFEDAAERLSLNPYSHRPGRIPGTREVVVHPNYVLVYRVGAEAIDVLALLHARQRYP